MAQASETYKGHTIVTDDTAESPVVTVDGQTIPVSTLRDERWYSTRMAYTSFASLSDLGRAIVDHNLIPVEQGEV